jgi:hypothetical protein
VASRTNQLNQHGIGVTETTKVGVYDMGLGALSGVTPYQAIFADHHSSAFFDPDSLIAQLKQEIEESQYRRFIFSFEGLLRMPNRSKRVLYSIMSEYFSDINIIIVVRRQDTWAMSAYSTLLTNTNFTDERIININPTELYTINYAYYIQEWLSLGSNIKLSVYAYEDYNNIVEILNDALEFQLDVAHLLNNSEPINSSLSALGQEVMRQYNLHYARLPSKEENHTLFRRKLYTVLPKGGARKPSRADVLKLLRIHQPDNHLLAKTYLKTDSQFPTWPPISYYPRDSRPPSVSRQELEYWIEKARSLS